ncbi:MAG TPA: sugar phosphate isomerase/epimerase [Verrucomicrobiales bacterium]|nr:sugar phosphate isomerase/epimerase [Verrucomicrobiales bacterium]HIL70799.1 sugar phosphate isomerase/epimerase [Verrucomicrobiota bacterium]
MSFKICLNTSTIKPQPVLDKIHLASKHGYEGIELWINEIYEYIGQGGEVSDIEKALKDHGLIVPCMIAARSWGEAVGPEYPLALEEVKRRLELAARLGSPYLVATPPRISCDLNQISERYRDLLKLGRESGVKPTFEYISFFHSVSTLPQAWKVIQDSMDPNATLILDAFHNWNSGSTLKDLEAIPVEKISHYHIDDAHPDKAAGTQMDPDRVMPGDGQIDLKSEISILKDKGYRGTVSLELFNQVLWKKDPNEVLKIGMERLKSLL